MVARAGVGASAACMGASAALRCGGEAAWHHSPTHHVALGRTPHRPSRSVRRRAAASARTSALREREPLRRLSAPGDL